MAQKKTSGCRMAQEDESEHVVVQKKTSEQGKAQEEGSDCRMTQDVDPVGTERVGRDKRSRKKNISRVTGW